LGTGQGKDSEAIERVAIEAKHIPLKQRIKRRSPDTEAGWIGRRRLRKEGASGNFCAGTRTGGKFCGML